MTIKEQLDKDMMDFWDKLQERRQKQEPKPMPVIRSETIRIDNPDQLQAIIKEKLRSQVDPNSNTAPSQGGY